MLIPPPSFIELLSTLGLTDVDYKEYDLILDKQKGVLRRGFIEPVYSYIENIEKLFNNEKFLITSIMTGKWDKNLSYSNLEDIMKWIPIHYLHLLSLATGTWVSTPWLEFRTKANVLVKRIHFTYKSIEFKKGFEVIDYRCKGNIIQLMSQCPDKIPSHIIEGIRLFIKIVHHSNVNDMMADLFRAFEAISKNYGTQKDPSTIISSTRYAEIKLIIDNSVSLIKDIANIHTKGDEKDMIKNQVGQRIAKALDPKSPDEALTIINMMRQKKIQDIDIVPNDWVNNVNKYRNQIVHQSLFNFSSGHQSVDEALTYFKHLYDLLSRLLLKELNYTGEYIYSIKDSQRKNTSVDWVQSTTSPSELGYK